MFMHNFSCFRKVQPYKLNISQDFVKKSTWANFDPVILNNPPLLTKINDSVNGDARPFMIDQEDIYI